MLKSHIRKLSESKCMRSGQRRGGRGKGRVERRRKRQREKVTEAGMAQPTHLQAAARGSLKSHTGARTHNLHFKTVLVPRGKEPHPVPGEMCNEGSRGCTRHTLCGLSPAHGKHAPKERTVRG